MRNLERYRWLIALAAGVLAFVLGSSAQAYELTIRTEPGFMSCTKSGCVWGRLPSAQPHVMHVTPREVSAASDREWRERCRPTKAVDSLGVERYQYAAAGCEFGPR